MNIHLIMIIINKTKIIRIIKIQTLYLKADTMHKIMFITINIRKESIIIIIIIIKNTTKIKNKELKKK